MCMEDIRLGRKTRTAVRLKVINPGTMEPLVVSSDKRIHLSVWPADDVVFISPTDANAGPSQGYNMAIGGHPFELDIQKHGDAVTKSYSAASTAAPAFLLVIETFLDEN